MVPEGWEKRTLASLADYHNGRAFKPHDWGKEGLPIIRIAQMTNPIAKTDFYSGDDIEAKHKINNGDMLFSWSATLAVMLWNRGPAVLNQHIFKVEEKPGIDSDFLYHLLNNSIDALAEHSHGSTMKHIKKGVLKDFIVPVPSLHEQKKIAAILSSVDDAIQATQAMIDQTHRVKQGLLHQLLTNGIGHTQFKETEIGEIPETWDIMSLGNVCKKITDGVHQSVITSENGEIPFLYVSCIRDGRIIWKNSGRISNEVYQEISKGKEPIPGLILYTAVGSYGHAALVYDETQFSFQRHIAYILPDVEKVSPEFIVTYLNSNQGRQHADLVAVGNAQKTVTLKELSRFPLPIPSNEEQHQINKIIKSVNDSIIKEEEQIERLLKLKRGLMQDLLTGRVRVNGVKQGLHTS